jgi:DNA-directed RNA polymerase alpha subunit
MSEGTMTRNDDALLEDFTTKAATCPTCGMLRRRTGNKLAVQHRLLSKAVINALCNHGVRTVGEARRLTAADMLNIKGLGRAGIQQLLSFLFGDATPDEE